MTKDEHDKAVASLKEICREIGCSGLSPAMCDHAPQKCDIIRKLVMPANKVLHPTPESGGSLPAVESNSENTLPA